MPRSITTKNKPVPPSWVGTRHGQPYGAHKFVAIDGEADTTLPGSPYVLLSVGQDSLTNPAGLSWEECFEFIYDHYEPYTAFVGFYLGYDFTQWLKSLPEAKAWELLTREGQAIRTRKVTPHSNVTRNASPYPVLYQHWQFDLLAGKRFRLRPKPCDCQRSYCKCESYPWMYICDTGGFFQQSFLGVINPEKWPEPVVTPAEYGILAKGKESRSTASLGAEMIEYNKLENDVLIRVLRVLDNGFRSIGINLPPSKWFGPGQAAQEWLKNRAPTRVEIEEAVPSGFRAAARWSYFGGWFEIPMHGIIPGITYEYDINSAYPYIISRLPCLIHGRYDHGYGVPENDAASYQLIRATVYGSDFYLGTMLHRNARGHISRPLTTSGWYWRHELEAAVRAGLITGTKHHEWVSYKPCDCPPPLNEVQDLYQMRLRVGKDTPIGKACRLVYNSEYGKFAQSIGKPMYANPVYASLITAGCRTQILEAIAAHPGGTRAVTMIATDAVYFTSPHPGISISKELGDWDVTERHNLTQFKPGVYWDDSTRQKIADGKDVQFKSRGVNARDLAKKISEIDSLFAAWNGNPPAKDDWPAVSFTPAFQMTTALQALTRKDWNSAGARFTKPVTQSSSPWRKRRNAYFDGNICRTMPLPYGGYSESDSIESHRYDKKFGDEDPFSEELLQKLGVSPDGNVIDEYAAIFREA